MKEPSCHHVAPLKGTQKDKKDINMSDFFRFLLIINHYGVFIKKSKKLRHKREEEEIVIFMFKHIKHTATTQEKPSC